MGQHGVLQKYENLRRGLQAYFRQKVGPPAGDKASVWGILLDTHMVAYERRGSVRMIARLLLGLGVSIALVSPATAELRDDRRARYDAGRADRQRRNRAAHPPKSRNQPGEMPPQLVSRIVARPIWLHP